MTGGDGTCLRGVLQAPVDTVDGRNPAPPDMYETL